MSGWRSAIRGRRRRPQLRAERDPSRRDPRARSRPTLPVPDRVCARPALPPGPAASFQRHIMQPPSHIEAASAFTPDFQVKWRSNRGRPPGACVQSILALIPHGNFDERQQQMRSADQLNPPRRGSAATTVLMGVVLVAVLYFGREVLVPIALAILMSFALAPLVALLQRAYFPRIAAVFLVVLVAFTGVFALGGLMASQVNQLANDLPGYQSTLSEKIQSLRGAASGSGTLKRASELLHSLIKELDHPKLDPQTSPLPTDLAVPARPIPVEVRQPDPGALQTLAALITPLLHPLATTGIVVIFVIFILIQQQDLRNRLVRLAGSQDPQRTPAPLGDAAR